MTGLVIILETPNANGDMDILRIVLPDLHLSRTEQLSEGSASNLSFSAMNRSDIRKELGIKEIRAEVFTSSADPALLFYNPASPNTHPAILTVNQVTTVNIGSKLQPTLQFNFWSTLPSLHFALHSSQLRILANILARYSEMNTHSKPLSPSPTTQPILSSSSPFLSNSILTPGLSSRGVASSRTTQFEAKEEDCSDDEDAAGCQTDCVSALLESDSVEPVTVAESIHPPLEASFRVPPLSPPTLVHVSLSAPYMNFVYVPHDIDSPSPFLHADHVRDPSQLGLSFVQLSITDSDASISPELLSISAHISASELFPVVPTERSHLPLCCADMFPNDGYYISNVFRTHVRSSHRSKPFGVVLAPSAPLLIAADDTVITLPLGLPKLCNQALTDINIFFPSSASTSSPSSADDDASSSSCSSTSPPIPPSASSSSSNAYLKATGFDDLKDSSDSSLMHSSNPPSAGLGALFLTESALLETGVRYSSTVVSIPRLVINFEIPLPHDLRFSLPLRRRERLSIDIQDLQVDIHNVHRYNDSVPRTDPIRYLSATFLLLHGYLEKEYFSASKRSTTTILSMEPRSSNAHEITAEPVRMEWREKPSPNAMTGEEMEHAPFSVPSGKDMGSHKEALSRQQFENLASHPCNLSIALTLHMITFNLSPQIYSVLMDAFDEYTRVSKLASADSAPSSSSPTSSSSSSASASSSSPKGFMRKGPMSPLIVDVRSKYGVINFNVEKEPSPIEAPVERYSPKSREPLVYRVQVENARALQISSFLGTKRSIFAVQVERADLHHDSNTLFHVMSMSSIDSLVCASYVYCSEIKSDLASKGERCDTPANQWCETSQLVELRYVNLSWTFSDRWPQQIAAIFARIERKEYQLGAKIAGDAKGSMDTSKLVLLAKVCSFGIWGTYNPSSSSSETSHSPSLPRRKATQPPADASSSDTSSLPPRLIATPQLVIAPHHFGIVIDMYTWVYHAHLTLAQLYTTLDKHQSKEEPKFAKLPPAKASTTKEYWESRHHKMAGVIGTSTATCVSANGLFEANLKCGLDMNTTVDQLAALQLLYSAYMSTPSTPTTVPSPSKETGGSEHAKRGFSSKAHQASDGRYQPQFKMSDDFEPMGTHVDDDNGDEYDNGEQEERVQPPRPIPTLRFRPPPEGDDPRVNFEPSQAGHIRITSEEYSPTIVCAPLKFSFTLSPAGVRWRCRNDPSSNDYVLLQLGHVEARYEGDENESTLLELTVRSIEADSQIRGKLQNFFGFDVMGKHWRQRMLYFTWRSCLRENERSAPRSKYETLKSSYSDSIGHYLEEVQLEGEQQEHSNSYSSGRGDANEQRGNRFDRFRFFLLPMQLSCSLLTFHYLYSFYRAYTALTSSYEPSTMQNQPTVTRTVLVSIAHALGVNVSNEDGEAFSTSAGASSSAATRPSSLTEPSHNQAQSSSSTCSSPPSNGPYFRSFYVGDMRLRLNIPGLFQNASIRVPSVMAMDVLGWDGVSEELRNAYAPHLNEVLAAILKSFPGAKLISVAKESFLQLVRVPIDEDRHGRSASWGFVKALATGIRDIGIQTIGLAGNAIHSGSAVLSAAGSAFDVRDPNLAELSERVNPDTLAQGAQQGGNSFVKALQATGENLITPLERYRNDPDASFFVFLLGSVRTVPFLFISPLQGALAGASNVILGATNQLQADHTTRPATSRPTNEQLDIFVPSLPPSEEESQQHQQQ